MVKTFLARNSHFQSSEKEQGKDRSVARAKGMNRN